MNVPTPRRRAETGRAWLVLLFVGATSMAGGAERSASFCHEIAPILIAKCIACHGSEKTKGGYQLHTFESLMKAGESKEPAVTPGQPAQSRLFQLITAKDPDDRMPQKDDPLAPSQIALIEQWIRQGAIFDGADRRAALATLVPPGAEAQAPPAYPHPVPILALAFSRDGKELAASGYHEITIWNPVDASLLRRIGNMPPQTPALAYSPDGTLLAAAGGSPGRLGEVKILDPHTGRTVASLARTTDMLLALAFAPDGHRLAVGGADNFIRTFALPTGREELRLELHADWVMGLTFSPDGSQLASASRDKSARLIDATSGELEQTYLGHGQAVFTVAFSADGKRIFSGGRDKQIHLWQGSDAKTIEQLKDLEGDVIKLITSSNQLFSVSSDGQVRQFIAEGKSLRLLKNFSGHTDIVYALAYDEPSRRLATGSYDGEVRIWNADSGELLRTFVAAPGYRRSRP